MRRSPSERGRASLPPEIEAVIRLVLRYAATITVPGVALGLVGAWLASRWLAALLFAVEAGDPLA